MQFAFNAHSDTRYLVLFVAALAVLYALFGVLTHRRFDKPGLILLRVFTGVLDLQVLLGLITLFTRPFFSALIGHLLMMIGAAAVAHLGAKRIQKQPEAERSFGLMLASVLIPLLLIVGGILAIQRPLI